MLALVLLRWRWRLMCMKTMSAMQFRRAWYICELLCGTISLLVNAFAKLGRFGCSNWPTFRIWCMLNCLRATEIHRN